MTKTSLTPEEQQALATTIAGEGLNEIATRIQRDWKNVYFGAKPYLNAMFSLNNINESYDLNSGKSIVVYFLGNATTWRGDVARTIKKELNKRIK